MITYALGADTCPVAPVNRMWDTPRHSPTRPADTDPAFPRFFTLTDTCRHCAVPITAHRDTLGGLSLWFAT